MLEEVLGSIHNWFEKDRLIGELHIVDGELVLPHQFLQDGQYFRLVGSVFNDGLHRWPDGTLADEEFDGEVWALAVPAAVIELANEIDAWCKKNPESAYTSESFGGYSYTKGSGADGMPMRWQDVFRRRLNQWRKLP